MIVLNKEQSEWIKKNFCLSKSDLPTDFYLPKDLIEILSGTGFFRGKDYLGDSMSFIDDCLLSFFARNSNKKKFELLFSQLHNFWIKEAKGLEYYELLSNLYELNEQFIEFVRNVNEQQADYEVKSMLKELGIITQ
jgi:hypothetical protein